MSIFCPNCGSELADDAKFCTNCGTPVNAAPSEPVFLAEPVVEEASPVVEEAASTVEAAETVNYDFAQEAVPAAEPAAEAPTAASYFESTASSQPAGNPEPSIDYQQTSYADPFVAADMNATVPQGESKTFSIVSLICGILSIPCCCCGWMGIVVAVAALVFGIIALVNKKGGKGLAIAGIVCGGIGLILATIMTIVSAGAGAAMSALDPTDLDTIYDMLEMYGIDM